ncbi:MAG: sialidase family protein [Candidatus Latescibacterota bacterium]|jgi:hypothetical protein
MKLLEQWDIVQGEPGTDRAMCTFPSVIRLANEELLLAYRIGSTKDSDDETVELRRSADGGRTWSPPIRPFATVLDGVRGSLKLLYFTELTPGHLLGCAMWVDREAFPGKPLFDAETEGCLPMAILIAESQDHGHSWSAWRRVKLPAEVGPPSLTAPLLSLGDGVLAMSIESNKTYEDGSRWMQRVVHFRSRDRGRTWPEKVVTGEDLTGRVFNWDQRAAVGADGRVATFTWTYDSQTKSYRNIHRRVSTDQGRTWSVPEDLGITDQAGRPAILPDGGVVLPWVDRFVDRAIKVRRAPALDAPFAADSEVTLYRLPAVPSAGTQTTGDLLAEMGVWTYGLPFAEALPDGEVLVFYYAGDDRQLDLRAARVRV